MSHLTSKEANQLADNFLALAKAVVDFRFSNWKNLNKKEKEDLGNLQDCLLDQGEDILALSVSLVMEEVEDELKRIETITGEIKSTLKKLKNTQKVINIAAAVVTLASAIIVKDTKAISKGIGGLAQTIKEDLNENPKEQSK